MKEGLLMKSGYINGTVIKVSSDNEDYENHTIIAECINAFGIKKSFFIISDDTVEMDKLFELCPDVTFETILTNDDADYKFINNKFKEATNNNHNIITDINSIYYLDEECTSSIIMTYCLIMPFNLTVRREFSIPSAHGDKEYERYLIDKYTNEDEYGFLSWKRDEYTWDCFPTNGHEIFKNLCFMDALSISRHDKLTFRITADFFCDDVIVYG